MVTQEAREFLEIDLQQVYALTATKTQGRYGNGQGQEYAEEFFLDYWRPGFNKWRRWQSFAAKSWSRVSWCLSMSVAKVDRPRLGPSSAEGPLWLFTHRYTYCGERSVLLEKEHNLKIHNTDHKGFTDAITPTGADIDPGITERSPSSTIFSGLSFDQVYAFLLDITPGIHRSSNIRMSQFYKL
ncbi:DNA damage responsive protein [Homalodisca vitripennis]|nr:DNA damage responsive protein [Homalodisca vitripennis]